VALFAMLTGPLNAFPWALNGLVESFVSIKRISQLLALSKIDPEKYFSPISDVVDEVSVTYFLDVVINRFIYNM
jgi:hypothetical protein